MKVEYIARKVNLTSGVRDIAEKKLARVEKYFNDIIDLRLEVSQERHLYVADIFLKGKDFSLKSTSSNKDLTTAIQDAIDKLEMQARKAKARLKDHKRHGSDVREDTPRDDAGSEPAEGEDTPRIVETSTIPVKPMSVEEAALQLEESEERFLVFYNSVSDKVNVVYRRADNNLGLITPEA
ncbi:MAG: ribosome-associated translation inhibitor RaiA [Acidobacteria bacterium]|nr:MAG: ribosome-associated translation inhibitor RaiA [Acidobacteriota bacterium]